MDAYVELTAGTVYDHSNGDQYKCLGKTESGTLMERVSDGWTLVAHGTRMDENGLICWNYSTGGYWPDKGVRAERICKHGS
mgnify:CR=1 FL=1